MNFKKFSKIAFALVATSAAFAQAGGTPQITHGQKKMVLIPDISVKIEMFEDKLGQKPIPRGTHLQYVGVTAAYVRFTLGNSNSVKTGNFIYKRVIYRNGVKVFGPPAETITLNAGEVKVFPMERVEFSPMGTTVKARILADIGNLVKETQELNNGDCLVMEQFWSFSN